jgi:hydrogenase maturation protein HypF
MSALASRLRLRVRGAVQGVGFRPFAYGLAQRLELAGFVLNDGEGVLIEIEGGRTAKFLEALRTAPPPLARIDAISVEPCEALGVTGFAIAASRAQGQGARIGADAAVCEACLNDLFDPASRFYRYPLVNCTHCGPRYTLTRALPYDRAQTSMAPFPMCADCARDYADPANRRFHAEPIACAVCGPQLDAGIDAIASCIAGGGIAAAKGLGGYHLISDARNEEAVARLRERKGREAKPFAVMALNAASAGLYAEMSSAERALFESPAAPIVCLRAFVPPSCLGVEPLHRQGKKEAQRTLSASVAPGLSDIGLMRAYTPLHWLIFHALLGKPEGRGWRDAAHEIALVATSANLGGEPLIADDAEARRALADIADLIVTHPRAIVVRADDSVMRVVDGAPTYLRRARGFAPDPIDLGRDGPCILAHGGDLKNTVTITRGREAFVSQYIGDLDDRRTIRFRQETIAHLISILGVKPEYAACDLHPDFVSARDADTLPCIHVQHHVAHVAATAAERGWRGRVLGVALDGFGYGDDGGAWGGELIGLEGPAWRRLGHLAPLPLPGGDRAAREPWRMGVALLHELGRGEEAERRFPGVAEAPRLAAMLARGAAAPPTTSLGRWFDAVAALAGVCLIQHYEGQAAMQLEALVAALPAVDRLWRIEAGVLDLAPLVARMLDDRLTQREIAEAFHAGLVAALGEWIGEAARQGGYKNIALGGGCLANRVMTEGLCDALRTQNLEVALPRSVPANDGGLSFGQAAFALAKLV